jgi:hypothetical protein
MAVSWMICRRCHGVMPIQRSRSKRRKQNHIKTMWCPWCRRVTQHFERY